MLELFLALWNDRIMDPFIDNSISNICVIEDHLDSRLHSTMSSRTYSADAKKQ